MLWAYILWRVDSFTQISGTIDWPFQKPLFRYRKPIFAKSRPGRLNPKPPCNTLEGPVATTLFECPTVGKEGLFDVVGYDL
jgi:hypothetical protein